MRSVYSIITVCVLLAAIGFGCDSGSITTGQSDPVAPPGKVNLGDLHNEVLASIHQNQSTMNDPIEAAIKAANEITDRHGIEPLTRQEVTDAIQWGRDMALRNPIELIRDHLSSDEFIWFMAMAQEVFADDGSIDEVEQRLIDYKVKNPIPKCAEAAPRAGGICSYVERTVDQKPIYEEVETLGGLTEIMIASSNYWTKFRLGQKPKFKVATLKEIDQKVYIREMGQFELAEDPEALGWLKRVARFVCFVAVDAVAGGLSAPGAGVVGAAVIGGLASHGADRLLFD